VGLDNAENIDVCRKRGISQVYSTDLERDRFPLDDEVFDAVICLEVLEHIKNPRNLLDEIRRSLRPNGYLVVSTPNSHMPTWRIRDDVVLGSDLLSKIYSNRVMGQDENRYSKEELEQLLVSHGFGVCGFRYPRIVLPSDDLLVVARKSG
jgi:SAM-dependent methyltransferase